MLGPMTDVDIFFRFGVALSIGVLVGLQREFAGEGRGREFSAGMRTFGLIGLCGCGGAMVSTLMQSPWPFVSVLLVLGLLITVIHYFDESQGRTGYTTKISALLTVIAGALAYLDRVSLAVAIGVTTTVMLSVKPQLHRFVQRVTEADIAATLKFAVITAIVLPVLPNRAYGPPPFDLFNPLKTWLFVVFVSAISFAGYVLIKVAGARRGIGLTGLLGGIASSTAVTLSFTQRSREVSELSRPFALAILMAWTVMFARVVTIAAVLNSSVAKSLWLPALLPTLVGGAYCIYLYRTERKPENSEGVSFTNPFELGSAITFGLVFVVILFLSNLARLYFGNAGIYVSSFVSGLADVDAIALSMTRFASDPQMLSPSVGARAIVIAVFANTALKGAVVLLGGAQPLRHALLPGYLLMLLACVGGVALV